MLILCIWDLIQYFNFGILLQDKHRGFISSHQQILTNLCYRKFCFELGYVIYFPNCNRITKQNIEIILRKAQGNKKLIFIKAAWGKTLNYYTNHIVIKNYIKHLKRTVVYILWPVICKFKILLQHCSEPLLRISLKALIVISDCIRTKNQ